MHAIFEASSR